jgi:hypothetical protein
VAAPPEVSTVALAAWRDRSGFCGVQPPAVPSGFLRPAQIRHLSGIAGQVAVSHDLLAEFADRYAAFPGQLAAARTRELTAVRALLERYGSDPHFGYAVPDDLRERGLRSRTDALDVIVQLATGMIGAIEEALIGLEAVDVRMVYLGMLSAAHRQRRLAQAWGARTR